MSLKKKKYIYIYLLRVKGWKKVFQANGSHKQETGTSSYNHIWQSRCQTKPIRREGHLILTIGTIHWEDISILNIYAPNTGVPIYPSTLKMLMALRV
jgi:hypothetical protein